MENKKRLININDLKKEGNYLEVNFCEASFNGVIFHFEGKKYCINNWDGYDSPYIDFYHSLNCDYVDEYNQVYTSIDEGDSILEKICDFINSKGIIK